MADDPLDRLCRQFGLDAEAVRGIVGTSVGDANPWYLRVAIGIGGWITAAAMILLFGSILGNAVPSSALPSVFSVFGAVTAAGAVALCRAERHAFAVQCAIAAALAGQAMVVGGFAAEFESLAGAAVVAGCATAVLAYFLRDNEVQFLSSAATVGLVLAALVERDTPQAGGILLIVTLPPAIALLVRPPAALDLRGLAWALLLVPLAALAIPDTGGLNGDRLARVVYALAMLATLALLALRSEPGRRPMVLVAGAVALSVGAVTVAGVLGSLLLLTLAYLLGSRLLATLGTLAHVGFVGWFYYDLDLDLLTKSWMLTAAGVLLLALWWLWSRRPAGGAADA